MPKITSFLLKNRKNHSALGAEPAAAGGYAPDLSC